MQAVEGELAADQARVQRQVAVGAPVQPELIHGEPAVGVQITEEADVRRAIHTADAAHMAFQSQCLQVGIGVQLIDAQVETEGGAIAHGNGESAADAGPVQPHVQPIGLYHVIGGADGGGDAGVAQPVRRPVRDRQPGPVQQRAQIVGRGLQGAVQARMPGRGAQLAGEGQIRPARQQRAESADRQFPP